MNCPDPSPALPLPALSMTQMEPFPGSLAGTIAARGFPMGITIPAVLLSQGISCHVAIYVCLLKPPI